MKTIANKVKKDIMKSGKHLEAMQKERETSWDKWNPSKQHKLP